MTVQAGTLKSRAGLGCAMSSAATLLHMCAKHAPSRGLTEHAHVCRAVSSVTYGSAEQLAPVLHRLIALCCPTAWPLDPALDHARPAGACDDTSAQHARRQCTQMPDATPSGAAAVTDAAPESAEGATKRKASSDNGTGVAAGASPSAKRPRLRPRTTATQHAGADAAAAGVIDTGLEGAPAVMCAADPLLDATFAAPRPAPLLVATAGQPQQNSAQAAAGVEDEHEQKLRAIMAAGGGSVRVLLALRRLSQRHSAFVAELLPRMLASQHGFAWPVVEPLLQLLRACNVATGCAATAQELSSGQETSSSLAQAAKLTSVECKTRQISAGSGGVDAMDGARFVGGGEAARRSIFCALATLAVVANAALEMPDMMRTVPQQWVDACEAARQCVWVQDWPVRNALPLLPNSAAINE